MTETKTQKSSKDFSFEPIVMIRPEALDKLDFFIEASDVEISGFGAVTQLNEEEFLIEDIYTFEQESSGGGTEIDGESLAAGIIELINEGVNPENMRLWWHSHVNMSAYFSITDTDTMEKTLTDAPWMISIVGNKSKDYRVRFDLHRPLRMWADNQTLYIYTEPNKPSLCQGRECLSLSVEIDGKYGRYCQKHEDLKAAVFEEEKFKNKRRTVVTVTTGKDFRSGSANAYAGSRGIEIESDWADDWGFGYARSEYLRYQESKICEASSCYRRIERQFKFCEEHGEQWTQFAEYVRELKDRGEVIPDSELSGIYELCDVNYCNEFIELQEAFYKGVVLCDEHLEDFLKLEFQFGEFSGNESPTTMLAILEYYLDNKDKIDEGDVVAEENLLDLVDMSGTKLSSGGKDDSKNSEPEAQSSV